MGSYVLAQGRALFSTDTNDATFATRHEVNGFYQAVH